LYYKFTVQSRNAVGLGLVSNQVTVIAARTADTPLPPLTVINGNNVVISWSEPFNGGTPITSYTIKMLTSDGISYA
jgi:hypothetical protein